MGPHRPMTIIMMMVLMMMIVMVLMWIEDLVGDDNRDADNDDVVANGYHISKSDD